MDTNTITLVLSIVAVIGIPVGILFTYYFMKNSKKLRIIFVPSGSLIDVDSEIKELTRITYDGKEVKNLANISFKIINTGLFSIIKENLREPIQLKFGEGIEIIKSDIVQLKPQNIVVTINNDLKNISKIDFDMLPSKGQFIVRYLVTGDVNAIKKPELIHKIVDIKKIQLTMGDVLSKRQKNGILVMATFFIIFGILMLMVSFFMVPDLLRTALTNGWFSQTNLVIFGNILFFILLSSFFIYNALKNFYLIFIRSIIKE